MLFKTWLEIENLDALQNQLIAAFMDSGGKDTFPLQTYADYLEERGDPFGEAIRMAITPNHPRDWHGRFSTIMHDVRMHDRPTHTRSFTSHREGDWFYVATFPLNQDADPMARRQSERSRYWRADIPAGGIVYRFSAEKWAIQRLIRPQRAPKGVQPRRVLNFSSGILLSNEFGHEHFQDLRFRELPQYVASHFFLIALSFLYWGNSQKL